MKIILHIGTEKTGTSTIQSLLTESADQLREQQLAVPTALRPNGTGDNNIVLPAIFCQGRTKERIMTLAGIRSNENTEQFKQRIEKNLSNEIQVLESEGIETLLISSEHLSSRLVTNAELIAMREWLKCFGSVEKIIIYLRRQDQYLLSTYSTAIKSGSSAQFKLPQNGELSHRYDYKKLLSLWSNVFGKENIIARPFEKSQLKNNNLIDDFFSNIGFAAPNNIKEKNINPSLDVESLSLLRTYNQYFDDETDDKIKTARSALILQLEHISGREMLSLSSETAREFIQRYNESNNWVAHNFLGKERLFIDLIKEGMQERMPPELSFKYVFEVINSLLQESAPKHDINNINQPLLKKRRVRSIFGK